MSLIGVSYQTAEWGHTSLTGILLLSEECPRIIKL